MKFRTFLKRFQLDYLSGALKDTFARFPLSVPCCAAAAVLCLLRTHDHELLTEDAHERMLLFLWNGLVFFTAAKLFAEAHKLSAGRLAGIWLGGGLALLALVFVPAHCTALQLFVAAALALSMLFAPYIGRNATEDSFWYYNYLNGIALVIAGISTFILCLGLSAVIGSMDYLIYNMQFNNKIYADLWVSGALFFGPLAFMHQIPRQFDFEKGECAMLPGVYFIANYLIVPLVLIYAWVLYVYFAKIAFEWELPKGNLAYMVTGFGAAGVAARLAVFPMRQNGTRLLQQFYKYFYFLLVVPLLLLAVGLYTRISQYGVTEERYAIGLCLAWLSLLAAYYIVKPGRAHIKHVPMLLSVLFLAAALGPWSAVSISTHSQKARLETMLAAAGVLKDGGIVKTNADIPFAARKEISSILEYLLEDRGDSVAAWVAPFRAQILSKYKLENYRPCPVRSFSPCQDGVSAERIMEAWGVKYVSPWAEEDSLYFSVSISRYDWLAGSLIKVAPYTHLASVNAYLNNGAWSEERVYEDGAEKLKVVFSMADDGVFRVALPDGRSAAFALQPLAGALYKEEVISVSKEMEARMIMTPDSAGFPAKISISSLRGQRQGGSVKLDGASLLILFSP